MALEMPSGWWPRDVAWRWPKLTLSFLNAVPIGEKRCISTVRLQGPETAVAVAWLARSGRLEQGLVLHLGDREATIRIKEEDSPVTRICLNTGCVPQFPFVCGAKEMLWLLLPESDQVLRLTDWMAKQDLGVRTVRSGRWQFVVDELTVKQRDVLRQAVDEGYYDYPRRITMTALAGLLGVAPSTLSESLMVIEHKIMADQHVSEPAGLRQVAGADVSAAGG